VSAVMCNTFAFALVTHPSDQPKQLNPQLMGTKLI